MNVAQKTALGSVAIGLLVLGLKFAAYWLTGSIALYSDVLESTINVVAAVAAFIALRIAAQPADSDHPYGHQKAEYFSAVFRGRAGRSRGPVDPSFGLPGFPRS